MGESHSRNARVLIVGAGVAGLAAARAHAGTGLGRSGEGDEGVALSVYLDAVLVREADERMAAPKEVVDCILAEFLCDFAGIYGCERVQ